MRTIAVLAITASTLVSMATAQTTESLISRPGYSEPITYQSLTTTPSFPAGAGTTTTTTLSSSDPPITTTSLSTTSASTYNPYYGCPTTSTGAIWGGCPPHEPISSSFSIPVPTGITTTGVLPPWGTGSNPWAPFSTEASNAWTSGAWTSWWGSLGNCPPNTWSGWTTGTWSTDAAWTSWTACSATTTATSTMTVTSGGSTFVETSYGVKVAEATSSMSMASSSASMASVSSSASAASASASVSASKATASAASASASASASAAAASTTAAAGTGSAGVPARDIVGGSVVALVALLVGVVVL